MNALTSMVGCISCFFFLPVHVHAYFDSFGDYKGTFGFKYINSK